MQASAERATLTPPPQPGLLRGLGLALLAHAALLAALTWGVQWHRDTQTLAVEAELWASIPVEAAPPPAAEPEPEPAPPPQPASPPEPPPPDQAQIALERAREQARQRQAELEAQRQERLKQEKAKLEAQRLALQEKERLALKEQALKAKKAEEKAAQDRALAEQRKREQAALDKKQAQQLEALRKQNLQRLAGLAGATGGPNASGTARQSAGPSAGYAGRIRARVKPNIVFTEEVAGNPSAEVEVRTSPDGTIVGRRIVRASGEPAWDEAVLKALDKTQVLPRDTDGRVPASLILVFRPKD